MLGKTFNISFGFQDGSSNISAGLFNIMKKSSITAWECPTFSTIGSSF